METVPFHCVIYVQPKQQINKLTLGDQMKTKTKRTRATMTTTTTTTTRTNNESRGVGGRGLRGQSKIQEGNPQISG